MENILIVVGIIIVVVGLAMKFTKKKEQKPFVQTEKRESRDDFEENKAIFRKVFVYHPFK